jgi:hypothetical protein
MNNQELGETTGVYVLYDGGACGNFVAAMLDVIRNPKRKITIDNDLGNCHAHEELSSYGIGFKDDSIARTLCPWDNYILSPIEYDFYILTNHPHLVTTQGLTNSIFTNTKIIRIYIDPQDDALPASYRYLKILVDVYIKYMNMEPYSDHLYNPHWEVRPWNQKLEIVYKKNLFNLGYKNVIDPRSVDVGTYIYLLYNQFINSFSCLRKIPEQENMLQINMKDLVTRKYNVIDEIATLMGKSLTSEQRQTLCNYMDEYADKQPTYEKMKERYNVSLQRNP